MPDGEHAGSAICDCNRVLGSLWARISKLVSIMEAHSPDSNATAGEPFPGSRYMAFSLSSLPALPRGECTRNNVSLPYFTAKLKK